jgi:integrase
MHCSYVGSKVVSLFLAHAKANLKPRTHEGYSQILLPFAKHVGTMDANTLQPRHVNEHIANYEWGKTTKFNTITAIKRAWRWAHDEGHISLNGIVTMKRPRPERRVEIMDEHEVSVFLKNAKPAFREILNFIHWTGCRPGEASMIERRHVSLPRAEIRFRIGEDKTSGKTDKPRVIHLSDDALALITRLYMATPSGPLFRNSHGNPWTDHAMANAVSKIRLRTGLDGRAVVYSLRHQWATDALARGVPLATVAEMMGNSPEIVARVYSHLSDKKALLMAAANAVRPRSSPDGPAQD